MRTLRWLIRHRPVTVTFVLVLSWVVATAWSGLAGQRKLTDDEIPGGAGRIHIAVELDFEPEAFHVIRLQGAGRLIEVKGETAYMMDVPVDVAREIASEYWVRDVRRWEGR